MCVRVYVCVCVRVHACVCVCVRACLRMRACVFAYACVLASVHEMSVNMQNVLSMQKKKKLDSACSSVMTVLQGMGDLLIKPAYEHFTHG